MSNVRPIPLSSRPVRNGIFNGINMNTHITVHVVKVADGQPTKIGDYTCQSIIPLPEVGDEISLSHRPPDHDETVTTVYTVTKRRIQIVSGSGNPSFVLFVSEPIP